MLHENLAGLLREALISVDLLFGDGEYKTIDIRHAKFSES
jgi:hypothetical protein